MKGIFTRPVKHSSQLLERSEVRLPFIQELRSGLNLKILEKVELQKSCPKRHQKWALERLKLSKQDPQKLISKVHHHLLQLSHFHAAQKETTAKA